MRILFLTEGTTAPSTRFRVHQFLPHFEANHVSPTLRSAYGPRYNELSTTRFALAYKGFSRLRRALAGVDASRFDIVFLQRSSLRFTAVPERLIEMLNARIIFDIDDAVFMNADGTNNPRLHNTVSQITDLAAHVICGNHFLASEVGHSEKTTVIPTVIDAKKYTPDTRSTNHDKLVMGWMGTSSNFRCIRAILPALLEILDRFDDVVFRIVSNATFPELEGNSRVEQISWSAESELDLLRSFDVGIMPLADTPWSRGKCGFKMIQYMSVGIPVVASAIGANNDIFEGSNAGFLATTDEDWISGLTRLLEDAELRREAGEFGRQHVVENYSIESVVDDYIEVFNSLM